MRRSDVGARAGIIGIIVIPTLSGCATAVVSQAQVSSSALIRDTTAYAVASCFSALPDAFLRDQGYRWAGGIIERGSGPMEAWTPIAEAVKAELKRGGIGQGKPEGPDAPNVALPVMTCGEIADAPGVAAAIATVREALAGAYRAAR